MRGGPWSACAVAVDIIGIGAKGQREIVKHEICGFRFTNLQELQALTLRVIDDEVLRKPLAFKAYERSRLFNYEVFKSGVENIFSEVEALLLGQDVL